MHQAMEEAPLVLPPTVLGIAGTWAEREPSEDNGYCARGFSNHYSEKLSIDAMCYRPPGEAEHWIVSLTVRPEHTRVAVGYGDTLAEAESKARKNLADAAGVARQLRIEAA